MQDVEIANTNQGQMPQATHTVRTGNVRRKRRQQPRGKPHSKSRFCIPTQGDQRGEKDAVEAVGVRSRQPPFTRCESKTPEKSAFKTCKQLLSESTRLEDVKQIRPGQHHEQERPRSLSFR